MIASHLNATLVSSKANRKEAVEEQEVQIIHTVLQNDLTKPLTGSDFSLRQNSFVGTIRLCLKTSRKNS